MGTSSGATTCTSHPSGTERGRGLEADEARPEHQRPAPLLGPGDDGPGIGQGAEGEDVRAGRRPGSLGRTGLAPVARRSAS